MSDKSCAYCPKADAVHEGKDATVFLMAVVNVPGKVPVIITTPKFCKELPADASPCDVCRTVDELVDTTVIKAAVDVAAEIRNKFKPKEAPCQTESAPPSSTELPTSPASGSSDCPKRHDCGNCEN